MGTDSPQTLDLQAARRRLFAIIDAKSLIRGKVVLASGRESDHYFDMKPTMFDPEGASLLARLIVEELRGAGVECVGGLEMGAVPLIGPIIVASREAGRPMAGFFVRKAVKDHGTRRRIEGVRDLKGKRVAIVEDVTTTGGSAMSAVEACREAGAEVALVVSILDRGEGAEALYRAGGIPFRSLFTAKEFLSP